MPEGFYLTLKMGPLRTHPVPREVVDALLRVQVTSSAGQSSGFQLSFAISQQSFLGRELLPGGFFDPPRRVQILVTLHGQTNVLMDGVITRQDFAPGVEPGQSTLTVTGVDVSQMMDLVDLSGLPWPGLPAEARVGLIIAKYVPFGMIPIVIPTPFLTVPNPVKKYPTQRGTDLNYVKQLAGEVGYTFYVEPTSKAGVNYAYWGPEIKVGAIQPALSVNMGPETNVESLSFSFDGMGKKIYLLWVKASFIPIPLPVPLPDMSLISPPLGRAVPKPLGTTFINTLESLKQEDSTAKLEYGQAAMRGLARAAQSAEVVSASGSLDVTRYGRVLKARQLVGVRGAGELYDGHYFVKSVTHTIQRGSYKQNFTLSRNARVPLFPKVKV